MNAFPSTFRSSAFGSLGLFDVYLTRLLFILKIKKEKETKFKEQLQCIFYNI